MGVRDRVTKRARVSGAFDSHWIADTDSSSAGKRVADYPSVAGAPAEGE